MPKNQHRKGRGQPFLLNRVATFEHNLDEVIANFAGNWRMNVFIKKGFSCVRCGRTADKLVLWYDWRMRPIDMPAHSGLHVDLLCGDVLMTVDHIRPKALGGSNHIGNLQPMCAPCNTKKGCKLDEQVKKPTSPKVVQPRPQDR